MIGPLRPTFFVPVASKLKLIGTSWSYGGLQVSGACAVEHEVLCALMP